MKKIFYTVAFLFALSFAVSSCTEDNVKPTTGDSTGGAPIDPVKV